MIQLSRSAEHARSPAARLPGRDDGAEIQSHRSWSRQVQPSDLTIDVITTAEQFATLADAWNELVNQSQSTNPFLTWEWVTTWHERLARGPLNVLVAQRSGHVLGIVPFEEVTYRLPLGMGVPTLQMIGRGTFQYELRGSLCLPGYEGEVMQTVVSHLQQQRQHWYCAVFDGLIDGSAMHDALKSLVQDRSDGLRGEQVETYVLELPESWEAFRSGLKRNIKESLRHCYNSLAREGHTYAFEVWDEPDRLSEALDRFLRLHRSRAQLGTSVKHRDYFGRPGEEDFLRAVAPKLIERGILHPCFLRVDGEIVAARLTLELNGQLYLYYSGFDPRWWKYSVATTITAECIKWAIERRLHTVNLSLGRDLSKTRWGGRELHHRSVVALRAGWLPRVAFATYSLLGRSNPSRWKQIFGTLPGMGTGNAHPDGTPRDGVASRLTWKPQ